MNKLLVVVFPNEAGARDGVQALRKLNADGDLTLYAASVIAKDAAGQISVKDADSEAPYGAGLGLAVGAMVGLLGGPVGVAVGALTGTVVGSIRDFWVAGVGLDFVEEARRHLEAGKVAVVAEVEEEWVYPVDSALEALGGQTFRRTRSEIAEAQYSHDVSALKAEIDALRGELARSNGVVESRLKVALVASESGLDRAVDRAKERAVALKQEGGRKIEALEAQVSQAQGEARSRLETRRKQVESSYHARTAKLAQAWALTREALSV